MNVWNQTYEVDCKHGECPVCHTKFDNQTENKIHHHVRHKIIKILKETTDIGNMNVFLRTC
jgi:hypothetical protein